jgi:hypothetical protein
MDGDSAISAPPLDDLYEKCDKYAIAESSHSQDDRETGDGHPYQYTRLCRTVNGKSQKELS